MEGSADVILSMQNFDADTSAGSYLRDSTHNTLFHLTVRYAARR